MKAKLFLVALGLLNSPFSLAHPEHSAHGLLNNLGHLLSEPDHLLALVLASVFVAGLAIRKRLSRKLSQKTRTN